MRAVVLFTVIMLGGIAALLPRYDVHGRFLSGVAYAPSHNDSKSPDIYISEERIREDLEILFKVTRRVRTYTIENGMHRVPAIARELHMRVSLGIWLGPDKASNRKQIEQAIPIIRTNSDVIDLVFVGNETLLRHDLTQSELREYLRQIKNAIADTSIRVTTGETWGFWLKNRELAEDCDIVAAHILPYWDGYPVEEAGRDISEQLAALKATFPEKTIVIAETGWPSRGQVREGAIPSAVNQRRFYEDFLKSNAEKQFDYYVVEAFDQPWKLAFEGEVGPAWGIFDVTGTPKLDLFELMKQAPRPSIVDIP